MELFFSNDKMPPIKLIFADNLSTKMRAHSRIGNPKLMANAKVEFFRLKQYIYVDSDSHIASPLVWSSLPRLHTLLFDCVAITVRLISILNALLMLYPTHLRRYKKLKSSYTSATST